MYIAYFNPNLYINLVKDLYVYVIVFLLIKLLIYYFIPKINYFNKNKIFLLNISEIHYDSKSRYLRFIIHNNDLLDNHDVLKPIFNTLMNNDKFINFGYNKIIILTAITQKVIFTFHHNVLINNDTPFENYYLKVKDIINSHYENEEGSSYEMDNIPTFEVLVWNIDNLMNKNIKITSDARTISDKVNIKPFIQKRSYHNYIKPLKIKKQLTPLTFASMDIETIELNGFQIPILISLTTQKESKIFFSE